MRRAKERTDGGHPTQFLGQRSASTSFPFIQPLPHSRPLISKQHWAPTRYQARRKVMPCRRSCLRNTLGLAGDPALWWSRQGKVTPAVQIQDLKPREQKRLPAQSLGLWMNPNHSCPSYSQVLAQWSEEDPRAQRSLLLVPADTGRALLCTAFPRPGDPRRGFSLLSCHLLLDKNLGNVCSCLFCKESSVGI